MTNDERPTQERLYDECFTRLLNEEHGDTMVHCVACGDEVAEVSLMLNAKWGKHTCEECYHEDLKDPDEHLAKDK